MPNLRKILLSLTLLMWVLGACSPTQLAQTPVVEKDPKVNDTQGNPQEQFASPSPVPQICPICPVGSAGLPAPSDPVPMAEGFGIMGDSFYDEYQGDDQRGGSSHETTFNLVEILVQTRHLNVGPWGRRDEPRRSGYAYNWARSGATSETMIQQGQHTGLAEQIRQGKVAYVWIGIGANDFSPYNQSGYQEIYDGTMTDAQLQDKIDQAIANVTLAVDTVREAGAKGIVVTHFTQWELDPILGQRYPDPDRRRRAAGAVDAVNIGIQKMAAERNIMVFDQNAVAKELLPELIDNRYLRVGGERIDFVECGDEPQFSRLADQTHLGTVMNGLSANLYIIKTFNEQFGMNIPPLSDEEILRIAGFREE